MTQADRWYAAHLIMYVKFLEGDQSPHYVMENIILVRASSRDEVLAKAEKKAREEYSVDDPSFTYDGRRARWEYKGVRKYVDCDDLGADVVDGVEVTYLEYRLADLATLDLLLQGKDVTVEFDSSERSEPSSGG